MNTKNTRRRAFRRWLQALSIAGVLASWPVGAMAEYRLQSGDVFELSIVGLPEMKQRYTIGVDGQVLVPLIGHIKVAGLPLAELTKRLVDGLSNKMYQQKTSDGREVAYAILPDGISIEIVEYRPIYLAGDVAKPGEQKFRPGLTIRQAVAVAGGYDIMRFRMNNPILESADLRAEYETLWTQLATEQARLSRLQVELGEARESSLGKVTAPIAPEVLRNLVRNELEQLKVRSADLNKEKTHLIQVIKKADSQLGVLAEKKKNEEEGNQADLAEFKKVRELYEKGVTASNRLNEARRDALYSSNALLGTIVETTAVEQHRSESARKLEKADDQRRMEVLKELQEANVRISEVKSRLQSTAEKLLYTSTLQSQLVRGRGGRPESVVYRVEQEERKRFPADEDAELFPGDVIEITLKAEMPVAASVR